MAHYAQVVDGVVTQVIVADSIDWCEKTLGGEWIQTSYNTQGGVHANGKFPIHKNFAAVGYTFDGVGFAAPQPYPSWTLNQQSYLWESPVSAPDDGAQYSWDEDALAWVEIPTADE
jgi:hypothetical protein